VAASAALYLVIVVVTKTDALEWLESPWGRGDDIVIQAETAKVPVELSSRSTHGPAGVLAETRGASNRSSDRTKQSGAAPSASSTRGARDPDAGARPAPSSPGRTPAAGSSRSSAPRSASPQTPQPQLPQSSPESRPPDAPPPSDSPITLPPPLPPVEVTAPELPVAPPLLPAPELPALPTLPEAPKLPDVADVPEVPAAPNLPTLP
jgi:hypothetical protein